MCIIGDKILFIIKNGDNSLNLMRYDQKEHVLI